MGTVSYPDQDLNTDADVTFNEITSTTSISAGTGMAVGGATAGAGGVAFPATAVAVADANTLDDYEEGTFTPIYTAPTPPTVGYTTQTGRYTKIGNVVFFSLKITTSSVSGGSGSVRVGGLPFTTPSGNDGAVAVGDVAAFGGDYPSVGRISGASDLVFLYYRTAANGATTNLLVSDLATGASSNTIFISGTYDI